METLVLILGNFWNNKSEKGPRNTRKTRKKLTVIVFKPCHDAEICLHFFIFWVIILFSIPKKETAMKKRTLSIITILLVCLVLALPVNLSAFLCGNEGEKAYCGGDPGNPCPLDTLKTSGSSEVYAGPTIRELIIEGGGYVLQSSSYINGFLNKIELSGLSTTGPDYRRLQETLKAAIFYMEQARAAYLRLKTLAEATPYNQEVIYKLTSFEYDKFQKENRPFPYVFARVKDFLSSGDVTGVFNEFYRYTGQILDLMYSLGKEINAGIFPDISNVWSVNQAYAEFKLFGQYAAQVFYSIK
jgi:hypothetical protein